MAASVEASQSKMQMATGIPNKETQHELVIGTFKSSPESFGWLPCKITLDVEADAFNVGDLLRLEVGSVITTKLKRKDDIPLRVNGVPIGSVQFEAIGDRLALRVTELE